MNSKFTAAGNHVIYENTSIAECHNTNWVEQRKHAILFAAAPDLLGALQAILNYQDSDLPGPGTFGHEVYQKAYEAINKSTKEPDIGNTE